MAEDIYTEFADAMRSGDRQRASELADEFIDILSEQTDIDVAYETAANRLLSNGVVSGRASTLAMEVIESANEARQLRTELGSSIQALDNENLDTTAVADKVKETKSVQSDIEESYRKLRKTSDISDLGPILVTSSSGVLEVQADSTETSHKSDDKSGNGNNSGSDSSGGNGGKGSGKGSGNGNDSKSSSRTPHEGTVLDTKATVSVRNVGGTAGEQLSVTTDTELSTYSVSPQQIGTLPAGEEEKLTVTVGRDNNPGRSRLTLDINGVKTGTTESLSVVVADKQQYVDNAITSLGTLEEAFENLNSESNRSLRSFLKTVRKSLQNLRELQSQLTDGTVSAKQANQRIFVSKQQISSLEKKLDSLKFLSGGKRATLKSRIESIIETLSRAIEAGI
jgi:hypothetical protein